MEKVPMTAQGFDRLKTELKQLKTVERYEIIKAISEAREHGDLSENAEYHSARERQSFIEGRILELEDATSRADVIDTAKLGGETVTFGTIIKVADEDTDEEQTGRGQRRGGNTARCEKLRDPQHRRDVIPARYWNDMKREPVSGSLFFLPNRFANPRCRQPRTHYDER